MQQQQQQQQQQHNNYTNSSVLDKSAVQNSQFIKIKI